MHVRSYYVAALMLTMLSVQSGCDEGSDVSTVFNGIGKKVNTFLYESFGIGSPEPSPSGSPIPSPTPTASNEGALSPTRDSNANKELFREMYLDVFAREPKDRSEFGNWVDTMNQGASLEGVFRGLINSSEYKKLETLESGASAGSLKVFSEELANLELELPQPSDFEVSSTLPRKVTVILGTPLPSSQGMPAPSPTGDSGTKIDPRVRAELAKKYAGLFVGVSVSTLKRVLADEALRVVDSKKANKAQLAQWFGRTAVRLAQRNIDFGIPLRNAGDEDFHTKWAVQNSEDSIKWELLNRLLRTLNELNRSTQ